MKTNLTITPLFLITYPLKTINPRFRKGLICYRNTDIAIHYDLEVWHRRKVRLLNAQFMEYTPYPAARFSVLSGKILSSRRKKVLLVIMISRRNIRVKVMQALYTVATTESGDHESDKKVGLKILKEKINRSLDLLVVSILYTFRVAQYAEKDAAKRVSKYLPTTEDLNVNTKIAGNEFMWATLSEPTFNEKVKEAKLERHVDDEWVKKIYLQLAKTEEYRTYLAEQSRQPAAEKAIMQFIWEQQILANEGLMEHFTDELSDWEDDKDMTVLLMQNFFKNNNQKLNYLNLISDEKKEYSQKLLETVIDKEEYCMGLIKPKLVNWDTERVALIDQLLLRMGVCELAFFPTIPTKVTINEYIEIGKIYSTPQSGQFINGVLDNILKDLTKENKIVKEERSRKS